MPLALPASGCYRKQPPGSRGSSVVQTAPRLTLIGLALLHEDLDDVRVALPDRPHEGRRAAVSVPILAPQQRIGYLSGGTFFSRNFSTKICYELRLVLFGAHVLVQVPNLKNSRLPAIFLLKSRFSFTLPLGFL